MRRAPHENVATVLVSPRVLVDLELELMALDLRLSPVRTAPICTDGPRRSRSGTGCSRSTVGSGTTPPSGSRCGSA